MWSFGVVVFSPFFDQDSCFSQAVADFAVRDLVAEARFEAFALSVFPGAAWFDVCCLCPDGLDPVLHGLSNELWAVVRPNERWHAAQDEQVTQEVDDIA